MLWESWLAGRDTGEQFSYVLDGVWGYLLDQKGKVFLCVPESVTLYDTLQIRLLLRKSMFPHIQTTHQPDLSTVRSGFLPCWLETSLCHRNVLQMPPNNLSSSHIFRQMGVPCSQTTALPQGWDRLTRWEVIPGNWQILSEKKAFTQTCGSKLSLLWTRRQGDKQWPEGWEHLYLVSALRKGWEVEAGLSTAKSPFPASRYFWSSCANCDSVFACYFSTSRPSVNQQQCARRADLPLPAARLCFPLTHPPGEAPPRSLPEPQASPSLDLVRHRPSDDSANRSSADARLSRSHGLDENSATGCHWVPEQVKRESLCQLAGTTVPNQWRQQKKQSELCLRQVCC